ncbi:transcription factor/nuclear export subunit protein 2-domain-containing protein [Radiomyces spectabilis]|uniref:transcription factor/nuclear export subunit protein 2-domain-containing protein n=1 Tax=Radiomyces spectabilis TaxID=64574 RepID=UPI002220F732|nr:transcription factor/nuclear export subunit protein 2-domain-containing protein [Radiomyces spectabilis]KAI8376199.1 transcription factor/nuclear export subunit protein 2-domain-containing protein [Radiomyces spectabilis]
MESLSDEIRRAKEDAASYSLTKTNGLRQLISRSTYHAYTGRRSIDSFVKLMDTLVKDDDGVFAANHIDARLLFINSLKTQDVHQESMQELQLDDETKEEMQQYKDNLVAMIKALLDAKLLSDADCKIHFSSQLLEDARVIPSKAMFDRRLVRLNTSMLYKQNKFNLAREDMAGYSALINDILQGSIDLEYDAYGNPPATPLDRVPKFLETISSNIGIFHLDPNRVLDILLDFFIKELLVNFTFWMELFKQSGWIQQLSFSDHPQGSSNAKEPTPQYNCPVMAHLLGFKFEHYQQVQVKPAPPTLYYACALLIANGLIRLGDLLPYLRPYDEGMEERKNKYMELMNKEIKTNSVGALAMYGALGEEGTTQKVNTGEAKPKEVEKKKEKVYTENDIYQLTRALITIGDTYHAELMFSKYDKLCDMHPQLARDLYRLCDVMLDPIYEKYVSEEVKACRTLFAKCAEESELRAKLPVHSDGTVGPMPKMKTVLTTDVFMDGHRDFHKQRHYVFFYKDWAQNLARCESFEHLTERFMPLMRLAGYKSYLAPDLYQKLVIIVQNMLERESDLPGAKVHCMTMLREFLLPCISFSGNNPGTMAAVWEILDLLTFQERCALYGEWATDFYKKTIETKLLKARTERDVKSVMRRVSKNDVRQCGRDLGKLAHSNPTIVFNIMLDQLQAFDNLAPYMADACRYIGSFAYDVLGYLMTEKWTGSQGAGRMKRIKVKEDGIPSSWLRALSVFAGMLYKKQGIDPTPLLRYMAFRLRLDDSVPDLVLFNEFVTKLSGIEIIGSTLTDDQITSAGCSDMLKAEAFQPISSDNRRATRRVLMRLKATLSKDNMALEILILLYRLNEACSAKDSVSTPELVQNLDRVHQTFLQYSELLVTIFDEEEYNAMIPEATELVKEYNLPSDVVMHIVRPKTRYAMKKLTESEMATDSPLPPYQHLVDHISTLLPDTGVCSVISPEFYVIFWQLQLYDIHCPVEHYEAAMKRHSDMIAQCRDSRSSFYQSNRPSVVAKAERHAQACLDSLREDLPKHQLAVEKTITMLKASQARWFPSNADRLTLISTIMQHCLLPRSVISEVDAVYCYEFVMLMHRLGVKNFSSLTLFDKVLSENLPAALMTFTDYETTIHARFIYKTFAKMSKWHQDEKTYVAEAQGDGLIGFQKKWNVQSTSQEVAKEDLLSFMEFKRVMHKWHLKASIALEQALQSGEAHQIRNAFLILRQFIPYFPTIRQHGEVLVKATQALATHEKRDDLKVLARSYLGLIEKSKARWVSKNVFLGIEDPEPEPVAATAATTATATATAARSSSSRHGTGSTPSASPRPSSPSRREERPERPDRADRADRADGASSPLSERKRGREDFGSSSVGKKPRSADEDRLSSRHE